MAGGAELPDVGAAAQIAARGEIPSEQPGAAGVGRVDGFAGGAGVELVGQVNIVTGGALDGAGSAVLFGSFDRMVVDAHTGGVGHIVVG